VAWIGGSFDPPGEKLLRLRCVFCQAARFCCPRSGIVAEAPGTIASSLSTRGHRDAAFVK
jgi:hypothetical protein